MQKTGLIDVLLVLEYAVQRMRRMMDGNDECESFAVMLDSLGLLGCSTDEAMKGLTRLQITSETPKPHPHIWDVVCLAACIFRTATFLREAAPREVKIVEDTLFYQGATICLPTLGEVRMIVIMGIFYHAVCKKTSAASAAIDLYTAKDTRHLLHAVHPHIRSAIQELEKPSSRNYYLNAWLVCNRDFCKLATSENFIDEFRTVDRLAGSMFAFVFAAGCVDIRNSPVLATKSKDIIGCLKFCLAHYKPPAGVVHRFHLHGTKKDALVDLASFDVQNLGPLNAMLLWMIKRAGETPGIVQGRAAELLVSLKNKK